MDTCLWGGRRRRTRRGKGPGQAQVAGPAPAEARPTPPTTAAPVHVAVPAASAAVPEAPSPSDGVLRAQIAAGLSRLGRSAVSHDFMWNINDTVSQSPSKHPADGSGYRYDDMQQPMVSQACRCQVCGIHALIQPFHSGFALGSAPGKTRSWRGERRDGTGVVFTSRRLLAQSPAERKRIELNRTWQCRAVLCPSTAFSSALCT